MESITLDNLLFEIANEVTEEELVAVQSNLEMAQSEESIKMVWRMYAADPFEQPEDPEKPPYIDNDKI